MTLSENPSEEERLRPKPSKRFEGNLHKFDVEEQLERIRNEDLSEEHLKQGHRQIELQRYQGTTLSLFHFEPGGEIPEHSLEEGLVILHLLEGKVRVNTENGNIVLEVGELLTLKSNLAHSLEAEEESHLLMTISR